MNYLEYYESFYKYTQALNELRRKKNKLTDIILEMLSVTSKIRDNDITPQYVTDNKMLSLTAIKLDLEEQIKIHQELVKDLEIQKNKDEIDLRKFAELKSADIKDKIYVMYYLDSYKVGYISRKLDYSNSHVYNLLSEIKKSLMIKKQELKNHKK